MINDEKPFDPGLEAVLILNQAIETVHRRRRRWPDNTQIERTLAVYQYIKKAVDRERAHEPLGNGADEMLGPD